MSFVAERRRGNWNDASQNGRLMVALAAELDQAQRKVVRLTWALFWLTVVLAGIGIAQLVASCHAP